MGSKSPEQEFLPTDHYTEYRSWGGICEALTSI